MVILLERVGFDIEEFKYKKSSILFPVMEITALGVVARFRKCGPLYKWIVNVNPSLFQSPVRPLNRVPVQVQPPQTLLLEKRRV
jgi:hypothetical protein